MKNLASFTALCLMLFLVSCGGPSDSEVKEGIEYALNSWNPRCSSISETLTLDNIRHLESKETDFGTIYHVEAQVNFRCSPNSEEVTEYTDKYQLRKVAGEWRGDTL